MDQFVVIFKYFQCSKCYDSEADLIKFDELCQNFGYNWNIFFPSTKKCEKQYLHLLVEHAPELLRIHRNLRIFGTYGLEHLNGILKDFE